MIEEQLLGLMEEHGVRFDEKDESLSMLRYSLEKGWVRFFIKDGKRVGFITWIVEEHADGNFILITNLLLTNRHSKSLFSLRRYFKENYGPVRKYQWINNRRKKSIIRVPSKG